MTSDGSTTIPRACPCGERDCLGGTTLPWYVQSALERIAIEQGPNPTPGKSEAVMTVINWLSCTMHSLPGNDHTWGTAKGVRKALLNAFCEAHDLWRLRR